MIKHMVMLYFTDIVKEENQDEIKQIIAESVNKIKAADLDGVIKLEPIFNIVKGMPEVGLYGEFESKEALEAYQIHPEHVRHKDLTKDYCRDRVVFDWE